MSPLSSADDPTVDPSAGEPSAAAPEAAEEAAPVDEVRQHMLEVLTKHLGDAVLGSHVERNDLWVRVRTDAWRAAGEACRDLLDCDYFCFLSGIDWLANPGLSGEKLWDPDVDSGADQADGTLVERGYGGGDTRFQVLGRLYSTRRHWGVTLKADLDAENPTVGSWVSVYRGADWHERETWEMYGFNFEGHPGLRHMYLPTEFEGFPLRKDFPLLAREVKPWPGLVDKEPIPGEADAEGESEAS